MNITIRNIKESDFEQLLNLFQEFALFEQLPGKMINSLEKMKEEKAFFHGFVAETTGDKIIGYASYFFCYYTWVGKALYLDDLYIRPGYRGKGVGTDLIRRVIEKAKDTGCHKVRWQVSKWNTPAIDFYKKIGAEINDIDQNCDLYCH
ncbi:MAG: GNAT family N-acetyltransferase [Tannerellaceae bacterium]|jgi:diamine N-acetyltransferase|nr:GNAT family N-acetyltransferase [Tannerellaceae bacterium]